MALMEKGGAVFNPSNVMTKNVAINVAATM